MNPANQANQANQADNGPTDGLPLPARNRAMLVIILGIAMAVLDGSVVNLALPGIARELNASAAHAIWVVNAYQIATLVMLLPLASLGERLGYRRVYLVGMALFALSSVGAMLADSLATLIVARAVQGLGAAGIMSVNAALVRLTYPRAQLGRGLAINSMVVALASVAGPSVAAGILSVAPWPWLFALNLPLGALTLWLGWRALPFNPPSAVVQPRPAALDVVLNVLMFTLIFVGGERLGAAHGAGRAGASSEAWGLLAAGVVVGWVYLRRQWRLAAPLFPVDLLRIPVFALSMGSSVGAFCAQTLAYLVLPFLLLEGLGRTPLQAGLLITAWPVAIVVTAPIAGRLIGRYADGLLGAIGMGVFACGLLLLAALPAVPSAFDMVWRMALCGAGFALFQSPNNHTIVTSAPLHRSGAASGMLGTARLTGQTMGAVLLATIFTLWPSHDGTGEWVALLLAAAFAVVAGVCSSLRLRATH
ncbi:MFS transporter [Acidovorax soli]|uniref:MFS transporter, DHA2 family, multidrug resistance protein n=1 Tax=Acidovorax soli TaxID=592050 RepID=A0A1H4EI71_9BURK|nr:MFS transporter [Acidovorax soli]SEA83922.1 MFS transporter, DHA2 family, multidrug resistance protein [Acidovorax soli]